MQRAPRRDRALTATAASLALVAVACASSPRRPASSPRSPTSVRAPASTAPASTAPASTASTAPASTAPASTVPASTVPPAVTGAPPFASSVSAVTAADLGASYHAGCPVGPAQLRRVQLTFWGFDGAVHSGTLVVNAVVTAPVIRVFARLYDERFPIRRMQPVAVFGGSDPASMAADNTSAFNCRDAVAPGPPRWSVHAYGEAIDVDPVENPYLEGGAVQPPAGAAFTDRSVHRAGMAFAGGDLVSAFAEVGWPWGGRWSSPDYQHFSANGG